MKGVLVQDYKEALEVLADGNIPVIVDPEANIRFEFEPDVIIDCILAKRNIGTKITDAPLVIGVGPGFTAGVDCNCVVETKRGHTLAETIYKGKAIADTGIPGNIGGFSVERIIRATNFGKMEPVAHISDVVEKGQVKVIGTIALEYDKYRPESNSREIGYSLARNQWKHGYMTEAAKAVIRFAFDELGLDQIGICTGEINKRSQRVIEKCGFKYEGTIRRTYKVFDGTCRDSLVFSMLKEEYEELYK